MLDILMFAVLGFLLGVVSGLVPGLHVNNFALLLAAAAPALLEIVPLEAVGVAMVAAAVTHTFLDIVPSVLLGVPDDAMALTALPGHRMVLEGRGREAIRLSAAGSMLSVSFGLVIAAPLTLVMVRVYPSLEEGMAYVLAGVVVFLVVTESWRLDPQSFRRRFAAVVVLFSSGLLGYYVFMHEGTALVGEPSLLMPLFAGLFGVPLLVTSLFRDAEIPRQEETGSLMRRREVASSAFGGSVAGAVVGWIPGVSPAVATTVVQSALPAAETEEKAMRSFIIAVSGVNTSNAIFALLALYFIERSRSGVTVALNRLEQPSLPRVALYLTALTLLFAGPPGLPVLAAGTVIGLVPNVTHVRRVHCMGSLMLPLITYYI